MRISVSGKDFTGEKFGRWTVMYHCEREKDKPLYVRCVCECGKEKDVRAYILLSGQSTSCGCYRYELYMKDDSPQRAARRDELTGKKFGRLTVTKYAGSYRQQGAMWECLCDCGNTHTTYAQALKSGAVKSCGCYNDEIRKITGGHNATHKMSRTRLYNTWCGMKSRCYNENTWNYKNYGGRGIAICEEWLNDFQAFYDWAMANGYRDDLSIDRINNDGNYETNNCRWVDIKIQANNRRSNVAVCYDGRTQNITEWADEYNLPYEVLRERLNRYKWDIGKALNKPLQIQNKKRKSR